MTIRSNVVACCSTSPSAAAQGSDGGALNLQFLFLDENVCKPCGGTGRALDEAVRIVAEPLAALGVALDVRRVHVVTREDALAHQLSLSPTIRINGVDIDPDQTEGECGSCGEIVGGQTAVNCRTWRWRGEVFSAAPVGKIVAAILGAAARLVDGGASCRPKSSPQIDYVVPENLENFFKAGQAGDRLCC